MPGNKTIIRIALAVAGAAALFFVYRIVWNGGESEPAGAMGLKPAGIMGAGAIGTADSDEFLKLLLSLRAIDLAGAGPVLSRLSSLEDFSTELKSEAPGRNNPFAPIGADLWIKPPATTTPVSPRLPSR